MCRLCTSQDFFMILTLCEVNCLSSSVPFEATWYQPSLCDACLVLRKTDVVELFRKELVKGFLREEIRLNWVLLDCQDVQ